MLVRKKSALWTVLWVCGVFLVLWILRLKYLHIFLANDAGSYIIDSLHTSLHGQLHYPSHNLDDTDKILVMAKTSSEDTDWVHLELPDWQHAIYDVSNPLRSSPRNLTVPANKGNEAMAYLTYVIDNYSRLPRSLAFIHSHRLGWSKAWHTDAPLHDNVASLRAVRLSFVQANGYVNLRCNPTPGCKPLVGDNTNFNVSGNANVPPTAWYALFDRTSTPTWSLTARAKASAQALLTDLRDGSRKRSPDGLALPKTDPDEIPPLRVAACAQFVVSRERVRQRPVEDYVWFRDWLLKTDMDDYHSGRVFEYLWHVIFGMDSVYCPVREKCYCDVYGRC